MTTDERLEEIVTAAFAPAAAAVAEGRIPAAVLGAVLPDGRRAVRWAGQAAIEPAPRPLSRDTWFDLASLTKVLLTVPGLLRLVEDGRLDLDDPLGKRLPELADPAVRALSLRACLSHQSGLVPHEKLYLWPGPDGAARPTPDALKALVLARAWPVGAPAYSDINYILAGLILERLGDRPLAEALPPPAGLAARPPPGASVAATEYCPWRGRMLVGEVHDENAAALGGLAGHAGLFGTVDGVLDFAALLLDGLLLSPAAQAAMLRPHGPTRALGWERPYPQWTGGSLCGAGAIGHLGFTGTGLWLDPERGIGWALLTNRVHLGRDRDTGIQDLRRATANRLCAGWSRVVGADDRQLDIRTG